MLAYISLTLLLAGAYYFLITFLLSAWDSHPDHLHGTTPDPDLGVTILIPARNEAANLQACVDSILAAAAQVQNSLEIIIVDDHSEDGSYELAMSIADSRIKVLRLADHLQESTHPHNAYKKLALQYGLSHASHDHVIQLDADVIVPTTYLDSILRVLATHQPDFLAAPVLLTGSSRLEQFQILDLMGMMAVTAAGIRTGRWHMANGANMSYPKAQVHYEDSAMASGDDVSTVQRLAEAGGDILFLKGLSATVRTAAMPTLSSLWRQRLRWATKNKYQSSAQMKVMMAIPFLNCLLLLGHPFLSLFFGEVAWVLLCIHLFIKLAIDYVYLKQLSEDFGVEAAMRSYWYASVVHVLYIALVGLASLVVRRYVWKGRRVS